MSKLDRLSALISRFHVRARVHPYALNEKNGSGEQELSKSKANFFIVRRGQVQALNSEFDDLEDTVPLLLYYPRGGAQDLNCRSLVEDNERGADRNSAGQWGYVCAEVDTGGDASPISLALPDEVIVRLDQSEALRAVTNILLEEAKAPRCGGQAVIDRLCEIVMIRLLRHLIEAGQTEVGLLAGLAHPNLALAIVAIHDNPERNFNLEDLAGIAAMSRTHFVNSFRTSIGITPGQYLSNWRLTLARMEIAKGTPLKTIARRIGFSSSAALSRAFTRHFGVTPRSEMPQSSHH